MRLSRSLFLLLVVALLSRAKGALSKNVNNLKLAATTTILESSSKQNTRLLRAYEADDADSEERAPTLKGVFSDKELAPKAAAKLIKSKSLSRTALMTIDDVDDDLALLTTMWVRNLGVLKKLEEVGYTPTSLAAKLNVNTKPQSLTKTQLADKLVDDQYFATWYLFFQILEVGSPRQCQLTTELFLPCEPASRLDGWVIIF
ncbi:hypothetical protein L914_14879 [Phytophthora nicotianae]|uniref:RxLR effector protein n=1 Tax=Phytophthora nicotianae TaxID=4792 RepID=W2MTE6_PHYNI|nr:hypothetical protein L914_14879 [Phytophthora nicotianae]